MKKSNFGYVAMWYGGGVALAALLIVLGFVLSQVAFMTAGLLLMVCTPIFVPGILRKRMEKNALALESSFPQNGFTYQHKFTSNSGVFYIDQGGRLGVVWRDNPTELQFMDLSKVTEVRTNNGQQLGGTALVSCQFKLDGKKMKIYTLRVSNGQLSMKDPRVIEAIQKAENLGAILKGAVNSAKA